MFNQEKKGTRLGWSAEEQQCLKDLYQVQGIKSWKQISQHMTKFKGMKKRTPKQCRERYTNHIKFQQHNLDRAAWSLDQDNTLFQKYMEVGSRWVQISKFLPNRSQNQIKNRFYGACRKLIRKINATLSQNKQLHKNRKPIKESSIFKLLETTNLNNESTKLQSKQLEEKHHFIQTLKFDCLRLASKLANKINSSQICEVAEKIHQFNIMTRFGGMRKARQIHSAKRKRFPPLLAPKSEVVENNNSFLQEKKSSTLYTSGQTNKSHQEIQIQMRIQQLQSSMNISGSNADDQERKQKPKHVLDLQYELSLILGIEYEPPNLFIF